MTPGIGACTFEFMTPPPTGSAGIAAIQLTGDDIDGLLARLGAPNVPVGKARLWRWQDVDDLVLARHAHAHATLFPHAGTQVLRCVRAALIAAGVAQTQSSSMSSFPEASSIIEARMLDALARARSPLAIDLLLAQPARWASGVVAMGPEDSSMLRRLIDPPTVVAIGKPNIGKSSLLNALAGRRVSIVADEPGTTRDHVGAMLEVHGLCIRYVDAPGFEESNASPELAGAESSSSILRESQRLAWAVAMQAELVLLCVACGSQCPSQCLRLDFDPPQILRVGLRADLGPPESGVDCLTSVREARGLIELSQKIRERLVPQRLIDDLRPWVFWT